MIYGVFHGDLHGGNLFVLPDGRTALLDFGITGRLDEPQRLAFLRLLIGRARRTTCTGQLAALRDLGALPADTDLDAVIHDLGLDQPPVDPTTLTGRRAGAARSSASVKALLGYGARMPKELMLFVKNMMFLDGAIATPRPRPRPARRDRRTSRCTSPRRHGERIAAELGIDPTDVADRPRRREGVASASTPRPSRLTYRDLQERRELIRKRLRNRTSE